MSTVDYIHLDNIEFKGDIHNKEQVRDNSYLVRAVNQLIGRANSIVRKDDNYNIKLVECYIRYAQPIKIHVWVNNIEDRAKFYEMSKGQNTVYRIYTSIDWYLPIEHLIDVKEF